MGAETRLSGIDDGFMFAVDTLRKLCFTRSDTKRLDEIITILLLWFEDKEKAAVKLLELTEAFERVFKSEKMEVLYPFENIKAASHEFGLAFFEGYFDWSKVSSDPYKTLAIVEKMLNDIDVARGYVQKLMEELKSSRCQKPM